ncbi:hypothetical protein SSABA_v1c03960 [Spiroplasma sabaudiense Ar-1343]|uniref:Uncharacterized protein n=1 Tax=Spiroplasma sabaudiense Ar-1343 TaxID=1276257 RepID=W6AAD8_9MOLU|nr:ATP-binding protein [Spiroplasma sabaudiense]AHI53805.1 hypothetical protein SSABA_v1c03960 [Spiroplasma sabaudiense Ar-1343]
MEERKMSSSVKILLDQANESIESKSQAILELVKNSFDADAKNCKINLDLEAKELVISDNGEGFSESAFDSFLIVSKSNKKRNGLTRSGRNITGMKGSGSYSTIRLGNNLEIVSNCFDGYELSVKTSWNILDDSNKKIEDIEFEKTNKKLQNKGTKIKISELSPFSEQDLEELESLINFMTLNDEFNIDFNCEDRNIYSVSPVSKMLKIGNNPNQKDLFRYYLKVKCNSKSTEISIFDRNMNEKKFSEDFKLDKIEGEIIFEYILLDLSPKGKKQITESDLNIFKNPIKKQNPRNLFYFNDMIVYSKNTLGLDLSKYGKNTSNSLPFNQPFGYTSIKNSNLNFNASRTDFVNDDYGIYNEYKELLKKIPSILKKKFEQIEIEIDNNSVEAKMHSIQMENNENNNLTGEKNNSKFPYAESKIIQKLESPSDPWESLYEKIIHCADTVKENDRFYGGLNQCISEFKSFKDFTKGDVFSHFYISFYSLIRVFSELVLIRFIKKNWNKTNDSDIRSSYSRIFQKKINGDTQVDKSIESLLRVFFNKSSFEFSEYIEKVREKIESKSGVKIDYLTDFVRSLNSNIHFPKDADRHQDEIIGFLNAVIKLI